MWKEKVHCNWVQSLFHRVGIRINSWCWQDRRILLLSSGSCCAWDYIKTWMHRRLRFIRSQKRQRVCPGAWKAVSELCMYTCKSARYSHPATCLSSRACVTAAPSLHHLLNMKVHGDCPTQGKPAVAAQIPHCCPLRPSSNTIPTVREQHLLGWAKTMAPQPLAVVLGCPLSWALIVSCS